MQQHFRVLPTGPSIITCLDGAEHVPSVGNAGFDKWRFLQASKFNEPRSKQFGQTEGAFVAEFVVVGANVGVVVGAIVDAGVVTAGLGKNGDKKKFASPRRSMNGGLVGCGVGLTVVGFGVGLIVVGFGVVPAVVDGAAVGWIIMLSEISGHQLSLTSTFPQRPAAADAHKKLKRRKRNMMKSNVELIWMHCENRLFIIAGLKTSNIDFEKLSRVDKNKK